MVRVKVKICGITNVVDALAAVDMGADILGFNFYEKSPRYVTVDQFIGIVDKLPTFIDTAGVFVNAEFDQIKQIAEQGYLNWIQAHGDESLEFCDSLKYLHGRTIKAMRVKSDEDIKRSLEYSTDAVLLDAYHPELYGGTGDTFDWNLIGNLNRRVFLAGGITPENAAKAIEVGVYGIDICSGIEKKPGLKDHDKMKKLFDNIRHLIA
jgi:phosphoribosylanthranilate isomerase